MKLPRPMVILLGAGATRAAFSKRSPPPPLDSDFFEIAGQIKGRGTRRLAQKVARDVFELYGKVMGIGLEQYYRDIETRLELSRFAKAKHRPKDWEARKDDLEELVRRVMIHTTCDLEDGPAKARLSQIHRSLLGRLASGDTIITFNYDTVIEESAPTGNLLWSPRDGYGVDAAGITLDWAKKWIASHGSDTSKTSKIQLLKLHGSLNWVLYRTSKVRLKPRPYVVRTRKGAPVSDHAAILPPGWHKRVDRNPYRMLWQRARSKLEQCATLVVIGYSLPETDLIARALFLEVARTRRVQKRPLRELHVADISEAAKSRIVEVFLPALAAVGLVFRYRDMHEFVANWGKHELNN